MGWYFIAAIHVTDLKKQLPYREHVVSIWCDMPQVPDQPSVCPISPIQPGICPPLPCASVWPASSCLGAGGAGLGGQAVREGVE